MRHSGTGWGELISFIRFWLGHVTDERLIEIAVTAGTAACCDATRTIVRQWAAESRLELQSEVRGSVTVQFAEDEEFERFCGKNHNYLIYEVGGRIAPRERIQFLKEFVMAAEMPDDHTARSHKREREAYVQQMKQEAEDEDIDDESQDDQD